MLKIQGKMEKEEISCKNCNSSNIVKRGFAKNKLQTLQKYQCKGCSSIFITQQNKGKTYPLKIILNSISTYNLGYSLEKTKEIINKKYNLSLSAKATSNWVKEYKEICAFSRLRKQATKHYNPKNILQPYAFKYHKAKLNILINENPKFIQLKNYLKKISSLEIPSSTFAPNSEASFSDSLLLDANASSNALCNSFDLESFISNALAFIASSATFDQSTSGNSFIFFSNSFDNCNEGILTPLTGKMPINYIKLSHLKNETE